MKKNNKMPVSERAAVQRINRKLRPDMQMLHKARSARAIIDVGEYYVVDHTYGGVVDKRVDVEDLARELGALKPWEEVESDE